MPEFSNDIEALEWALVQAYQNNPLLNAQRAALRGIDENVPQALSGYRLKLITASGGWNYFDQVNKAVNQSVFPKYCGLHQHRREPADPAIRRRRDANAVHSKPPIARARQKAKWRGRETLRVTEQQVLLDAATSYMNLLRDQAILDLNRRNVEVLTEQLKQTRDRFNVGEVTRTDVAQAESRSSDRNTRESTAINHATLFPNGGHSYLTRITLNSSSAKIYAVVFQGDGIGEAASHQRCSGDFSGVFFSFTADAPGFRICRPRAVSNPSGAVAADARKAPRTA